MSFPSMRNTRSTPPRVYLLMFGLIGVCLAGCASVPAAQVKTVRVATFNTALSRDQEGALHAAFAAGDDDKAKLVAEVLQRTRPDIVLLQEIDCDPTGKAYDDFQRNYLSQSQNGAEPIAYEYVYAPPVNTGVLADVDLDGDGEITRPNDCYGYGLFDGHYGMVVLSKYPIRTSAVYAMQDLLWSRAGALMPEGFYRSEARDHLRLSSKTHTDVPIRVHDQWLRLWISHPTPPVFDGPEDRNGRRNEDEIRLWNNFFATQRAGGRSKLNRAGQTPEERRGFFGRYVIMGDLNADPFDGESRPGAISALLDSGIVNATVVPRSEGAAEAARLDGGANETHQTDPATDTADWNDDPRRGSGNLRVDYVLPSVELDVVGSGVYWPTRDDPRAYLNRASDHHLVWIDLALE